MMTMRRNAAVLAAVLAGAVVAGAVVAGGPAAAGPDVSREEIFARLGVDRVPADYVILVDTSGSMVEDNRYGAVRSTLLPFLAGLSESDRVALYTFDARPTLQYQGPAGDPAAVVAQLPPGPTPDGPTDIGAALDAALREVERPDAAAVGTVVLVTDGTQDAPPASDYLSTGSPAWAGLADRARALTGRTVNAYALPIGTADGANLLGQVFPRAIVLDPAAVTDLGGYLDQAKEATRLAKAGTELAGDVGKGVTVTWQIPDRLDFTATSNVVRAELRSTTARVPLTVSGMAARSSSGSLSAQVATTEVTLAPGASAPVDVRLTWKPEAGAVPIQQDRQEAAKFTLTGTVTSPWAAALEPAVPLRIPETLPDAAAATTGTATVGHRWVLPAVAGAVLLLLLLLWLLAFLRRNPYMPGALSICTVGENQEVARFELDRRRPLDLAAPGLPGRGTVRGRRGGAASVEVSYSPDGSADRRTTTPLRPREPLIVSGLTFLHQTDEQAH
jgi:hypothetical protein